jgi:threonine dehydrogenase-like Zn-dependent dehydrogenase
VRAVRNTADGVRVVEVPEPEGPGVVVEPTAVGICGSDLHVLAMGPSPITIGHEIAGQLDGRPVAVQPFVFCGTCEQCLAGRQNLCTFGTARLHGAFVDGGMADRILVDERCIVELPKGLPAADACLVEPTAVAVHATNVADLEPGMRVAVVGAGPIGLLQGAVVAERGIDVDIIARHDSQHAAAEQLRLGRSVSGAYDVVFDAAGTTGSIALAVELVRPAGEIVMPAICWDPIDLPGLPFNLKEAVLRATMYWGCHDGRRETELAAEVLARSPHLAEALITHRFPLERAAEAFATAADRAAGAIKVVVEPA